MSLDVPSNERNLTHIVSSRLTEYNIIPLNVSTEIFQIILLTTVYGEMASVKTFYERAISGCQKNPLKVC